MHTAVMVTASTDVESVDMCILDHMVNNKFVVSSMQAICHAAVINRLSCRFWEDIRAVQVVLFINFRLIRSGGVRRVLVGPTLCYRLSDWEQMGGKISAPALQKLTRGCWLQITQSRSAWEQGFGGFLPNFCPIAEVRQEIAGFRLHKGLGAGWFYIRWVLGSNSDVNFYPCISKGYQSLLLSGYAKFECLRAKFGVYLLDCCPV